METTAKLYENQYLGIDENVGWGNAFDTWFSTSGSLIRRGCGMIQGELAIQGGKSQGRCRATVVLGIRTW